MSKEIKYFLILIIIVVSSNLALAVEPTTTCKPIGGNLTHEGCFEIKSKLYNTTTPIINVTFKEWVDVNNDYVLYKIGELGEAYPNSSEVFDPIFLANLKSRDNYSLEKLSSYSYQPTVHIPNGIYLFKVSAFNEPNVHIDVSVLFSINGTGMKFWVSSPTNDLVGSNDHPLFAFSNESVFDIVLETERDVDGCRFSITPPDRNTPLPIAYQTVTAEPFYTDGNNPRLAILYDFNISEYYSYPVFDGTSRPMYIICKEKGSERYSYNVIDVGVDQSAPSISVASDFSPIVDYELRRTNITIRTDDPSACTINKVYVPNYDTPSKILEMNNRPVIIRNSTYDFTKYTEFVANYAELLIFNADPSPHNYTYNITCTNLANLKNSRLFVVPVNLIKLQSFEFYSPDSSGYITVKNNILINGSTVMGGTEVSCNASFNNSAPFTPLTRRNLETFNGRQLYSALISVPSDGVYTLYVTCTYMYGAYISQTFTVDSTPPTVPNITSDENSCSLDEITVKAASKDNVSGVRRYYYNLTVNASDDEYVTGTSSSGQFAINIDNSNLEEGKTYALKIWAEDNAGNKGPQASKNIKITDDSSAVCDKTSPTIKINSTKNNVTNAWTVMVNCTDKGSGCKTTFVYGIEPNASNVCKENKTLNLLSPIAIITSATFCATVYDNNNNNASDSKTFTVTYSASCSNNATDGTETDLNCGGSCPKCGLNKTCSKATDCSTNYCLNKKCAQSSCTDKIKNGDEAGVDCGGSCVQKCAANSTNVTCASDDDCVSVNCVAGKCLQSSCTDKKQDGDETGIDCGGSCSAKCAEDSKCSSNADCETKYCSPSKVCTIDPLLDTDGDGMTDVWEKEHCGTITGCNPKEDLDKDKYNNKEEFDAKTDPKDPASHPDTKKYNPIAVILLIIGVLLIIAGTTLKVLDVLDKQKNMKLMEDKEMFGTLGQIPKMSSIERPPERELTEEEKARGQQARMRALKERSAERKKMINQFDSEDKKSVLSPPSMPAREAVAPKESISSKEKTPVAEPEQKPIPLKKTKTLDEGIKDEYVDLAALKTKKQFEDPFSKLKTIAGKSSSASSAPKTAAKTEEKPKPHHDKLHQEPSKKTSVKSSKDEDVFEKLKKISKSKKK